MTSRTRCVRVVQPQGKSGVSDTTRGRPGFGIWKSVYLLPVGPAAAAITQFVTHTFYAGGHPTQILTDADHAGFELRARAVVWAPKPLKGVLKVTIVGVTAVTSAAAALVQGYNNVSVTIPASATKVRHCPCLVFPLPSSLKVAKTAFALFSLPSWLPGLDTAFPCGLSRELSGCGTRLATATSLDTTSPPSSRRAVPALKLSPHPLGGFSDSDTLRWLQSMTRTSQR